MHVNSIIIISIQQIQEYTNISRNILNKIEKLKNMPINEKKTSKYAK